MSEKRRLSATVDAENLEAATRAFQEGRATSVSGWVNDAMRHQAEHDERMRALDGLLAAYEAAHGEIGEEEMEAAARRARERAVVVRARPARRTGRARKAAKSRT